MDDCTSLSFSQKVNEFTCSLNLTEKQRQLLVKELIQYTFNVEKEKRFLSLKKVGHQLGVYSEMIFFKQQYLDCSFYIQKNLWYNLAKKVQGKPYEENPVLEKDLEFCLSYLNASQQKLLLKRDCHDSYSVDFVDLKTFKFACNQSLQNYARFKVQRLYFLTKDPGLEIEDFVQEIICEIVRVINVFQQKAKIKKSWDNEEQREKDLRKLLSQYINKSVDNKVNSLIAFHCSAKRGVIKTTDKSLYDEIKKIKAKPKEKKRRADKKRIKELKHQIQQSNSDYYRINNCYEILAENELLPESESYHQPAEEVIWIKGMRDEIDDPRTDEYLSIVLHGDTSFSDWAAENNCRTRHFAGYCSAIKKYIKMKNERGDYDFLLQDKDSKVWDFKSLKDDKVICKHFEARKKQLI